MLYHQANAKDGKTTGDGSETGLFIPLPPALAGQFPSLGEEDLSPPHCTFLIMGEVPQNIRTEILETLREVLADMRGPVRAELVGLDYFEHPAKNRKVAFCPVRFSHDMAALRWKVQDKLSSLGYHVSDGFPLIYRPHVTLAYLEGLESKYRGPVPSGGWVFDSIQLWGLPTLYDIPLGNSTRRVASRFLQRT